MSDHEDAVQRISEAFSGRRFHVQTRGNNLPEHSRRDDAIYRPDLIVRREKGGHIAWLVEVETSEAGKSVVGATILADICVEEVEKQDQRDRPGIMFIFYKTSTNLQLANKRLKALERSGKISHLGRVVCLHEKAALKEISAM